MECFDYQEFVLGEKKGSLPQTRRGDQIQKCMCIMLLQKRFLSFYAMQQGRTGLDKALLGLGWLWAWLK